MRELIFFRIIGYMWKCSTQLILLKLIRSVYHLTQWLQFFLPFHSFSNYYCFTSEYHNSLFILKWVISPCACYSISERNQSWQFCKVSSHSHIKDRDEKMKRLQQILPNQPLLSSKWKNIYLCIFHNFILTFCPCLIFTVLFFDKHK